MTRNSGELGAVWERQTTVLVTNDGNPGPCTMGQTVAQQRDIIELAGDLE